MFRDLKEYQEIAKIYAEKVSKPEDLDERVRGGGMSGAIKPFEKPSGSAAGSGNVRGGSFRPNPINKPINSGGSQGRTRPQPTAKPETDSTGKVIPSTASIRAAAAAKRGGTPAIGGGNAGASTDSGGTSKSTIKSVPVEKEKPEVSTMTKQGKPRTKAQMMAAKRIASGKSIDDVKAANTASMKAKAAERNQKFQDAKKSGNLAQFRKDNPKMSGADRAKAMAKARLAKKAEMSEGIVDDAKEVLTNKIKTGVKGVAQKVGSMGKKIKNTAVKVAGEVKKGYDAQEEYTPYDIVLEYLLSTEQVATIEEANYVMTEMDAETIQGIVQEKKEGIFADPKLNKKYSNQPKMTEKGKKILPNLPDPEGMGSKKTKKPPRVFGDPTGEMTKDFFK